MADARGPEAPGGAGVATTEGSTTTLVYAVREADAKVARR